MKTVLELLDASAARVPEKAAFSDEKETLTYGALCALTRRIGSFLLHRMNRRGPVAVCLPKTARAVAAFFGVARSAGFYTVIDAEMPAERIRAIFGTLCPEAVLTDEAHVEALSPLLPGRVYLLSDAQREEEDEDALALAAASLIDTDPLYVLFTSGSTGVPKGAVVCHRSVLAYSAWVTETFPITEETVFGSQTPFYFSMSVLDIYSTIRSGAELVILPRTLFSFPVRLLQYMQEKQINTIYWVPSALNIVANWKALDYVPLPKLKTILFAGEVMPVRQLNYWISRKPDALFANLYGPTEVTDICAYYVVDRPFQEGETLPIGRACRNCGLLVVKEDGTRAAPGEPGELMVRGSFLALGYYRNPQKTAEVFVQNPLNEAYPETVYQTGDLVKENERGELLYLGRKDFQIKHMGYRIELGEIEAAAQALPEVQTCACLYDARKDRIVMICAAPGLDAAGLLAGLKRRVPDYMLPGKIELLAALPHNQNGKIDRALLRRQYLED